MKPGMPWSVKGIEPGTREAAKDAARRSGMTLGEWLNTVISDQADGPEMPEGAPVRQTNRVSSDSFERAASRLETIAEQLATIARRDQATSTNYVYQPEARADQEEFTRIVSRVEHSERRQAEEFAAVNDRLQLLGRQVTQSLRTRDEFRPEEHQSFQTLEKAVRNIVEHLESSEKRTRDSLKTMQERMSDIATRAAAAPNDQVSRQAPAITQLEARLSELSRKIDEAKAAPQVSMQELLATELASLTQRIDTVRDTAETLAAKAQTEAVQAGQRELRVIEDRILGLLKDAQTTFSSGSTSPAELLRLRTDIENLNKRIDATQKPSATDAEVAALKAVVDQMSSRIAQGPDMRPVVELHKRVNEIARRVDQTAAAPIVVPQLTVLEQRIAELDQRLSQAANQPQQQVADPRLEQKIAEVAERMDRTEQQLSHLGTIEKAINQLYDGLEANRVASKQAAEDVALAAIQQFASQQTAPSLAKAPEIIALQQGLNAIQESARSAEGRNQETLVALHETLEHIVGKLSELETAAIGQRVQQAVDAEMAAAPQAHAVQHNSFVEPAQIPHAAASDYHQQVELQPPGYVPAHVHLDEPHAEPLEPVQAAAEAVGANPFGETSHFSVDGTQPSVQPIAPSDASTTDLIAAARRAAQASHAAKSSGSFLGGLTAKASSGAGVKKESSSLFNRFKRKSTDAAAPVVTQPAARLETNAATASQTGQRKKLIFAGLVILAGVASFMFNMMGRNQAEMFPKMEMPAASSSMKDQAPPVVQQPAPDAKPFQQGSSDVEINEEPVGSVATVTQADGILTGSLPNSDSVSDIVSGKSKVLADMPATEVGTQGLRTAAAEGDPRAQFVVATRYMNGEKVERDFSHAAYWYGKAAASGLAPAQYRVATLYERGKGVGKDMKAALGWYERAASLGNVRSMHNAAVIASGKEAGAPDYARSFKWFSLASAYGLKDSQFNLAVLLERGLGTKAKPEEALFWYYVAARQNDQDAATRAANLSKSVAPELAARAKAKADMWSADRSDEAANNVAIDDGAWANTAG
jgi:localization factor PodJL